MLRKKEIAMVTFINVPFVIDALNPLHVWQCQEMLVHHSYIPGCPKQTLNIPFQWQIQHLFVPEQSARVEPY